MISPVCNRLCRCGDTFLITEIGADGANAGCHDQAPRCLWQGTDQRSLVRGCNDAICACFERTSCAFGNKVGDRPSLIIEASRSSRSRDVKIQRQDLKVAACRSFCGTHHVWVAADGQKIEIKLSQTAYRRLDRGADIKSFMSEDAFAVF